MIKMNKKMLSLIGLLPNTVFAVSNEVIKIGYGSIILLILFVLYKIIKEAEKEVDNELENKLPWEELKSVTKSNSRTRKKKSDILESFDKAQKIKKAGVEYYE